MPVKIVNKEYEAVVFDLDGTIYPLTFFNKIVFFMMNFKNISLFNAHRKGIALLRGKDFGSSGRYYDAFYHSVAERTGKKKEEIENWYFNIFYKKFKTFLINYCHVRENFTELINALKNKGVKTGVFSDYADIEERLDALGLGTHSFDIVFSGEKYGALKPEPRPLSLMIDFFGTTFEKVLLVGDRIDTDGACAEKSGTGFYHIDGAVSWENFCREILDDEYFKNK